MYNYIATYINDLWIYSYSSLKAHFWSLVPGLKVGWMTQAIWVTWVTFFVGQVGLIRTLNYLDATW